MDATRIKRAIAALRARKQTSELFGADTHGFVLNPPLLEAVVVAFEHQYHVRLPADYRFFLTAVGNGGAGPYYGVFPLGEMDGNEGLVRWQEQDGFIGVLSEPFLLATAWNDLTGMPSDDLAERDEAEYERQFGEFEKRYWHSSLVNGAIPICHEGCALRIWLVVTGEQAGYVWRDGRSDYTGLQPLLLSDGSAATFSGWYSEWLERAVHVGTDET